MKSVTLSPKFQIVIPKGVREELKLKAGMKISIVPLGGAIYLVPLRSIKELRGSCKGMDPTIIREPDREI